MIFCNRLKAQMLSVFVLLGVLLLTGIFFYEKQRQEDIACNKTLQAVEAEKTFFNIFIHDFNTDMDNNLSDSMGKSLKIYNNIIEESEICKLFDVDCIWLTVFDPSDGLIVFDGNNKCHLLLKPSSYLDFTEDVVNTAVSAENNTAYVVASQHGDKEKLGCNIVFSAAKKRLALASIFISAIKTAIIPMMILIGIFMLIMRIVRRLISVHYSSLNGFLNRLENGEELKLEIDSCFVQREMFEVVNKIIGMRSSIKDLLDEAQEQKDMAEVALKSIGDGIVVSDVNGAIVSINIMAEKILGCKNEEAAGKKFSSIFKLITKTERKYIKSPVETVLNSGEPVVIRSNALLALEHKCECEVELNATPVIDKSGKISSVIIVFRDITEDVIKNETLKNTNLLLKNNAEDMQLILEVSKIALWEYDVENKTIQASKDFYDLLHIDQKQHIEIERDILPRIDDKTLLLNLLDRDHDKRGSGFSVKVGFTGNDGIKRWFICNGKSNLDNSERKVTRARGVVVDVTENEEIQEELKLQNSLIIKSDNRLKQVYRLAKMFFWDYDVASNLITGDANFAEKFLGLEKGVRSVSLDRVYEKIDPRYHQEIWRIKENATSKMHKSCSAEFATIADENGCEKYYRNYYNFEYGEDNQRIRSYGIVLDITEEHEQQARLIQSSKMESIGMLAGGIAHDFNNMINGIAGMLELLSFRISPDDIKSIEYCQHIKTVCDNATELTKQLLRFSRKKKDAYELIDINKVIENTMIILCHSIGKGVDLNFDTQLVDPIVKGDFSELQNSILNLGINARDALSGKRGSCISIQVSRFNHCSFSGVAYCGRIDPQKEYVEISVKDNGKGIEPSQLKRVFEPFYTTKSEGKGTGLGLSALSEAITAHAGVVSVESRVGEGTVFTILLPLISGEDVNENAGESEDDFCSINKAMAQIGDENRCVLVIADESVMRVIYKQLLVEYGYEVIEAENGVSAIEKYKQNTERITGVILDLPMPELAGAGAFEEIVKINKEVKVVFVSGDLGAEKKQELIDMGALAVLSKPFRKRAFMNSIMMCFS